jgi:4-hydroxy-tetrahydrodipicolinate synthase
MKPQTMRGVLAPLLTPFNDDLSVATELFTAHAKRLIGQGCAGIVPFGTTGEALSVGIDERIAALRALVDAGVDPARMIPGAGLCDVADTARLSRACLDLGCAGVLTLPPFYYKGVDEDGLYRYFERLIQAVGADARLYLYHIPPVAIVGIPPALAARLHADFPSNILGIKDSSGDWDNTRALLEIDGLVVYPGSELPLLDGLDRGSAGCISATANVNAAAIAETMRLYDKGDVEAARALHETVSTTRSILQRAAPIPAQKRLLAIASGDRRWANVRPPLTPMPADQGRELAAELQQQAGFRVDCD